MTEQPTRHWSSYRIFYPSTLITTAFVLMGIAISFDVPGAVWLLPAGFLLILAVELLQIFLPHRHWNLTQGPLWSTIGAWLVLYVPGMAILHASPWFPWYLAAITVICAASVPRIYAYVAVPGRS